MRADLKKTLIGAGSRGDRPGVYRSVASPTGFPFKVAQLEGTSSAFNIYQERKRVCDLGYLREPYAPQRARLPIAARLSRWRTMWPKAERLKTPWAASACAMP